MRRSGFTLVELIFVIVIIGVLSAVAVPKFLNLKSSAEARGTIKTAKDAVSSAVVSAVNLQDLEANTTFKLNEIVSLSGKGWQYNSTQDDGNYTFKMPDATGTDQEVASVDLVKDTRQVKLYINCDKFPDTKTQDKCKEDLNTTSTLNQIINY